MGSELDIIFMTRALELAKLADGNTRPNPMVGAVIVHNGLIIGEGYHTKSGEPHAEVNAIRQAPQELLKESTIYVTLEPCSHYGKTPPCAELIVEKQIKRVVVGTVDTSSKVSGNGIAILKRGGCDVAVGVLESECRTINKRFFCLHEKGRPYIVLKWAESEDGLLDIIRTPGSECGPNWITGKEERILVHKWRSEEHSIMVGENTLLADDPELNVRYWKGINPLRVVISDSDKLPDNLKVFTDDEPLLLFSRIGHPLKDGKENIVFGNDPDPVASLIKELAGRDIQSVIVEGGANLLQQFIDRNMWDEARFFKGRKKFGSGVKAPTIGGKIDRVIEYPMSTLVCVQQ